MRRPWVPYLIFFATLASFVGPVAFPDDLPAGRMTFKQIISLSLQRSLDLKIQRLTANSADLNYKNAWATILPKADLQALHQFNQTGLAGDVLPGVTYPWSNQFALNLAENLYDNGESLKTIEITKLTRKIENLNLDRSRNALLESVTKAYLDYSFAAGSLTLQQQQLEVLRGQFRSIESRYHAGTTSNRDFLRIRAQVQRAEVAILNQALSVEASRSNLRLAMGVGATIDFEPYSPSRALIDSLKFDQVKTEQAFEVQTAALQDRISDIHFDSAERAYLPRLTANATGSYINPEYIGNRDGAVSPYWNFQASLILDYNLWDWGTLRRNVQLADNQRQIDHSQQEKVRITVEQSLSTLQEQIHSLQKSYGLSKEILRADEEAFSSLNHAYREGKVNYLELITGLSDLYASRTQFLSTEIELLKAQTSLAYYEGQVYETIQTY